MTLIKFKNSVQSQIQVETKSMQDLSQREVDVLVEAYRMGVSSAGAVKMILELREKVS